MHVSITKERIILFGHKLQGCRKEDKLDQEMLRVAQRNRIRREMFILHVNTLLVISIEAMFQLPTTHSAGLNIFASSAQSA